MQLTLNHTETKEYFDLKSSNESLLLRNELLQAKVEELRSIIDSQPKAEMDAMFPEESTSIPPSAIEDLLVKFNGDILTEESKKDMTKISSVKPKAKYLSKRAKEKLIPILNELCTKGCHTQHRLDLFCAKHGYAVQSVTKFIESGRHFYLIPGAHVDPSDKWTPTTKLDPDAYYIRACIY